MHSMVTTVKKFLYTWKLPGECTLCALIITTEKVVVWGEGCAN